MSRHVAPDRKSYWKPSFRLGKGPGPRQEQQCSAVAAQKALSRSQPAPIDPNLLTLSGLKPTCTPKLVNPCILAIRNPCESL